MTPAQLDVLLDRLCAEDRYIRLDYPGIEPEQLCEDAEKLSVVEDDGTIRERLFPEDVQWWRVVAFKAETTFGAPVEDPFDVSEEYY